MMRSIKKYRAYWVGFLTFIFAPFYGATAAFADLPENWQLGFQASASPIMESITSFHNFLLVVITAITLFVLVLLVIIMLRFNSRANPEPSTRTHNTLLEVIWTTVPILILVVIAIPSFRLLYAEDVVPESDMTVKLIGNQWYWTVEYPDHDDLSYDIIMLEDDERETDDPRLLAVDNDIVVPVNKTVRVITTSVDVIHAFATPALGVKIDAVPGRLNETWFKATREGTFYGQCSELCGARHAFMPTAIRVVSEQEFTAWLEEAQEEFGAVEQEQPVQLAANAATR
jgi:cytochrome c oxidase subunit 2